MHAMYGNKEPREFLETALDDVMTLVNKENALPRFSKVVSSIAETMIDQDQTDNILSGLEVVEHMLTVRKDHVMLKDSVDIVHGLMTDPQVIGLAERALIVANNLSKDEALKQQVGSCVMKLLKANAMEHALHGLNTAIQAFNIIISDPNTSKRVINVLQNVATGSSQPAGQQRRRPKTRQGQQGGPQDQQELAPQRRGRAPKGGQNKVPLNKVLGGPGQQ